MADLMKFAEYSNSDFAQAFDVALFKFSEDAGLESPRQHNFKVAEDYKRLNINHG